MICLPPAVPPPAALPRQRGVAIIAVTTAFVILAALMVEFGTNTTIDGLSSANARDQMRAEFLARSALNVAEVVIKLQTDVLDAQRETMGDRQITEIPMFDNIIGLFGGDQAYLTDIGAMMGGFAADAFKGLGSEGGTFGLELSTDDGKINMNCANGGAETQEALKAQLDALLFFQAFDPLFQRPDVSGWQRDRKAQVEAMIDYVDRDNARFGAPGTPEDYGYEGLDDRYKAKNNYLDSIGELRLIRGVDDRFWTLFGSAFTIYGGCRVNIGAVVDPKLIAALIVLSAKDPQDPVLRDPNQLWALAKQVGDARASGVYFEDLEAFAEYVKNPQGELAELFAKQGLAPPPGVGGTTAQPGVELDVARLGKIAGSGPRRTHRVEIDVEVPRGSGEWTLRRKLTAVWDTQTQNQNNRDPKQTRGAWVFLQDH